MNAPAKLCHDDADHVFLDDGQGVSCALCDCDYREWLIAFYPESEKLKEIAATGLGG